MHGLFIKDEHIKENEVRPEMRKLFLRISRESDFQPLQTIANYLFVMTDNRLQSPAMAGNCLGAYAPGGWK